MDFNKILNSKVIYSIQPKYTHKILSGTKRIEIRKRIPKLDLPHTCYVYCTKGEGYLQSRSNIQFYLEDQDILGGHGSGLYIRLNGLVVAEFQCNNISTYKYDATSDTYMISEEHLRMSGLSQEELIAYGQGQDLYGIHIDELTTYKEPRSISKFFKFCDGYVDDTRCTKCLYCSAACERGKQALKSAPQSWGYVGGMFDDCIQNK